MKPLFFESRKSKSNNVGKTIFTLLLLTFLGNTLAQPDQKFVNNQLLIKITESHYDFSLVDLSRNKIGIDAIDALSSAYHLAAIESVGQHRFTRTFLLKFENDIDVKSVAGQYKQLDLLDYAEPNYIAAGGGQKAEIIPNDTRFNKQWGLYNDGTMGSIGNVTADADVDMELAWDIQTGDPDMIIAISDSGLRLTHPDIASRVWSNTAETVNGIDDDANGLIDDTTGWDWVNNDNLPVDDLGHGSNIGGIVGAVANNNSLFTGANWNSKLMILKVLDSDNSATYAAMANSIYYAADKGAKVLSMSIGGGDVVIIEDAVAYANTHNMLISACMMNFNNNVSYYPAAYSTTYPNVIAVGSTNPDDTRTAPFFWSPTSGSNFGNHLSVVAPGNYIFSLSHTSDISSTVYWGGTSMATPLVAAIASLIFSENRSLTPEQVREILQSTADDQVGNSAEDHAGYDQYMGYGRANAYAALQSPLVRNEFNPENGQEFTIINPEQKGQFQIFSKGRHPGNYTVRINTMDGKLLHSETVVIQSGANTIPFLYPKGNYIITLKSEAYSKIFKVVKD